MKTGKRKRAEKFLESCKKKLASERHVDLKWNSSKLSDVSDLKWRRRQVKRYLNQNPNHKGKKVLAQIRKQQQPDPQPDANVRSLNRLIKRNRMSVVVLEKAEEKIIKQKQIDPLKEIMLCWDSKPSNFTVFQQRRRQVQKYKIENPNAKGKKILKWIQTKKPDPWPEASVRGINKLLGRLRRSADNEENKNLGVNSPQKLKKRVERSDVDINCDIWKPNDKLCVQKRRSRLEKQLRESPELVLDTVNKWMKCFSEEEQTENDIEKLRNLGHCFGVSSDVLEARSRSCSDKVRSSSDQAGHSLDEGRSSSDEIDEKTNFSGSKDH